MKRVGKFGSNWEDWVMNRLGTTVLEENKVNIEV